MGVECVLQGSDVFVKMVAPAVMVLSVVLLWLVLWDAWRMRRWVREARTQQHEAYAQLRIAQTNLARAGLEKDRTAEDLRIAQTNLARERHCD